MVTVGIDLIMKPYISHHASLVPRVASREVGDRAAGLEREGVDILHLVGWPVVKPPQHIIDEAARAAASTVHPHSSGIPELKVALASKLRTENGIRIGNPDRQIVVTNGAYHAVYICLATLLDPGDEVLLFSPSFFFDGIIELVGGAARYAPLEMRNGFKLDAEALEAAVTKRTKVILLNTPANPTGHIASVEELHAVLKIAERHDLLVVSDESYERMIYDGLKHHSIGALQGAASRVITVQSFTKAFAMPQWRVGYIACPEAFYPEFVKTLEWMVLACNYVAQRCALVAVTGPQDWLGNIAGDFQRKRDIICSGVSEIEGIKCLLPQGTPFVFPRVRDIGVSGTEFARLALETHGVPAVPGAAFQDDDHVRIPFGADDKVLRELVARLAAAAQSIQIRSRR